MKRIHVTGHYVFPYSVQINSLRKRDGLTAPPKTDRENWENRNNSVMHCQISLKFSKVIHYGSAEKVHVKTGTGSRNEPSAAAIIRSAFVLCQT